MAFPVTINGRTYTLADFEGTNYVDGFPDALEDFVTQAGDIYNSTSTSSVAIGTGSKSFTTADSGKPYQPGTPLRIADAAAPATNFMDCIVTSYSGTSLVVDAIGFGGSGTKSSWTINIGGAKTVDGTLAVNQGGTGATTASAAASNLGLGTEDSPTFSGITTTGDVNFGDNDKAIFGAGSDLQIYHDGSNSRILDNGTGFLAFGTNGADIRLTGQNFDEFMAKFEQDGPVTLYHNDVAKLATTATGIDVTGTVTADGLTVDTDTLHVDATNNRVGVGTASPDRRLHVNSGGDNTVAEFESTDASAYIAFADNSTTNFMYQGAEGNNFVFGNGSEAMRIASSGLVTMKQNLYMEIGGIFLGGSGANNYLDDYEEGTFTPIIDTGYASVTYATQDGRYTKVGNVVHFALRIALSAGVADSNRLQFGNLPFTTNNVVLGANGAACVAYSSGVFDNDEPVLLYIPSNSNKIYFYRQSGSNYLGTDVNSPASLNLNIVGTLFTA